MNVNLINDIINDFSKLYNELYKRRYTSLNELLDKSKEDLNIIKEKITSHHMNDEQNKEEILSEKTKNLISCIKDLLQNKLNKYVIDFLNLLKKCIQYKLWSKLNSHYTIDIMKDISNNPKSNIECMNKVVEVIHTIIFTSFLEINENDAINIYLINIKTFNETSNFQNYNFKNPIRLLFIALTDIIYKLENNEFIKNITKFLFSLYIKGDCDDDKIVDNKYQAIIKNIESNIYIKCLSLELLSQGLNIIKEKNKNNNFLEEIIKNKIILSIKNKLSEIKKERINDDREYIHLLKLLRFSIIIINNFNVDYDIILLILNFLDDDTTLQWQQSLSMECLQEILNNNILLIKIYKYNQNIISNIFNILNSIYEQNKNINNYNYKIKAKKSNQKQIEKNTIYLQGDEISKTKENEIYNINIIISIKECLQNCINSFSSMMNKYKISLNKINNELSKEQEVIKDIVLITSEIIKQILFDLIDREYKNNEIEESEIQKTINYIQNIIILYSSLNIINIRDEYLNKICKLCIDFDNEKNIVTCSSILSLSKFTQFYDKKNFILIFQTIEKIYIKYNNDYKKNFDIIVENIFKSYQKFFTENDSIKQDIEYKNEKKEKENLLISTINNIFIDSKSINISCLKNILEALFECLKLEIDKNNEENKGNEENEIIIFYLTKLLTLSLLNIENIYYFYDDYILPIINLLKQKYILLNFTINFISSIIKEILFIHAKIVTKLKSETIEDNNIWLLNPKWQKTLFEIFISFTTENKLMNLTKNRLLICIKAIIQQGGNSIDVFGWECIFKMCQILINENIEEIFLMIKLILNDYNSYLTIFNVMPIITLLGILISYQKDKNICFNSIELFWSCANIVEKFHKGKIDINDSQKKIYEELLKEEKSENFDVFYCGLYYKIFSQLLRINLDFRYEIRKNGINIFTEIFISKINTIGYENSFKIINDIFFNIFVINSKKYIDKEKQILSIKKDEDKKNEIINSPKKGKELELEQTLYASLLSIIKILKSFTNNIEIKSEINQIDNIFTSFLKKLIEIIPFGTISLNSDILHGISEIKNIQANNKYILPSKLDIFFEIMDKFNEFIHSERFKLTPYNKMSCLKLLNNLIIILSDVFINKINYEIFTIQHEQIFNKIFEILEFIFYANTNIEKKTIEYSPQRLTEVEENIFNFLQNIPIVNEEYIFNYLLKFINYDISNNHSGALCKKAIECFIYIMNKNNDNCFIIKENNKNFLIQIIDKFSELFRIMKNDSIKKFYNNNNNNKNRCDIMFNELMKQISQFFLVLVNRIETNNEDVILKINEFYENIFWKIIDEIKLINDISFLKEINELYSKVLENIIITLFMELSPITYAYLYEKENNLKNIENKLLKMINIGCYQINEETKDNINKLLNEPINKLFIINLFSICKFQSKEEILEIINKSKLINIKEKEFTYKYIHFKKRLTSLLIKKLNENLIIYRNEYENKKEEIIFYLDKIKNLDVFPELIEKENLNNDDKIKIDTIENKKIHIFYLYQNIIELICIGDKDIQIIIKDIMLQAFDIIKNKIPPLPEIFSDK